LIQKKTGLRLSRHQAGSKQVSLFWDQKHTFSRQTLTDLT
jgi:hypothetical protein